MNACKKGQVIVTYVVPAFRGSSPARIKFQNIQICVLGFLPGVAPTGNRGGFSMLILSPGQWLVPPHIFFFFSLVISSYRQSRTSLFCNDILMANFYFSPLFCLNIDSGTPRSVVYLS